MEKFMGFEYPQQNWSKLPNQIIEMLPEFTSLGEVKVLLYILRHTWGFQEFGVDKKITTDEFINGRKRKDGSRIDSGTGLSANTVIDGLRRAEEHGFILVHVDDNDLARIKKSYSLNMQAVSSSEVEDHESKVEERSEKETTRKKLDSPDDEKAVIVEEPVYSNEPVYSDTPFEDEVQLFKMKRNWQSQLLYTFEKESKSFYPRGKLTQAQQKQITVRWRNPVKDMLMAVLQQKKQIAAPENPELWVVSNKDFTSKDLEKTKELIEKSIEHHKKEEIAYATPMSIQNTFLQFLAQENDNSNNNSYLGSWMT